MELLVVIYLCWGLTVQLIELLKASLKQNWSSQVHLGSSVSMSQCVRQVFAITWKSLHCTSAVSCFPVRCLHL